MFFKLLKDKSRGMFPNPTSALIQRCLLFIAPAVICGCSEEISIHENSSHLSKNIHFSGIRQNSSGESTLDIFAFEDDLFRRLDSYQRLEYLIDDTAAISSTGGEKIFFFCMNSGRNRYEWSDICSYASLKDIYCELEDEQPCRYTMTAEATITSGERNVEIELKPLACKVSIKALGCDFSGTPYASASLKGIRIYMINVSASCPILCTESYHPVRIINSGMLDYDDLKKFRDPDIIYKNVGKEIFMNTIYPDICFLCYPNSPVEESPGSPYTRLVIEGNIDSETYYWPITINPVEGMQRGYKYTYDILIRRKGVTDPDIPIDLSNDEIKLTIKPWIEKDDYTVGF